MAVLPLVGLPVYALLDMLRLNVAAR